MDYIFIPQKISLNRVVVVVVPQNVVRVICVKERKLSILLCARDDHVVYLY